MAQLHIILADDDLDDCLILNHVIEDVLPGSRLTCFHNCATLFTYLESLNLDKDNCITPDLILLDLNMPAMTGQECLRKIRKNEICKNIPVIIYSTASREDIIEECYRSGATAYVVKPTDTTKLKQILKSAVEKFVYGKL